MDLWTHYILGIEDIWLVLLISVFAATHLTAKLILAFRVHRLRSLYREESGATYMLPLVLTIPLYVLLITMIIECTLLLTAKVGSVGAAYSAARAAAVWLPYENAMPQDAPDYTPLENRQTMVRLAAARAMFPYASGSTSHTSGVALDEFVAATANQQIAVFRTYSGNQKFDTEYLKRKFAYAYNSSTVEIKYLDPVSGDEYGDKEAPAFNAKIQLTLRYDAPIHTYGIARLFGTRSRFGRWFVRPIISIVNLENEGVKLPSAPKGRDNTATTAGKSLGIKYYTAGRIPNSSGFNTYGVFDGIEKGTLGMGQAYRRLEDFIERITGNRVNLSPNGMDEITRIAERAGKAINGLEFIFGVREAIQLYQSGQEREAVIKLGQTIGSMLGGSAGATLASTVIALTTFNPPAVLFAGLLGGVAGSLAGEALGGFVAGSIADAIGFTDRVSNEKLVIP